MKLIYRGVAYEYAAPQVTTSHADAIEQSRVGALKLRQGDRVPVLPERLDLIYRGVRYVPASAENADPSAVATASRTAALKLRQANKTPVLPHTLDLIYRGVHYTANPQGC